MEFKDVLQSKGGVKQTGSVYHLEDESSNFIRIK